MTRDRELTRRLGRVESWNLTFVSDELPIYWKKAAGSEVWDDTGKRYIDFSSAFGVASIGHSHPRLVAAIREQSGELIHAMGDVHPAEVKVLFLERLIEMLGFDGKAIMSLSGSEAVESAMKTAAIATGRPGILAFEGAYHGLGYGSLAATHRETFKGPFRAQLGSHVVHAPFPKRGSAGSLETSLSRAHDLLARGGIGAVLVEPIQGRGGIIVPPDGFLRELLALAHGHGALLVLDEVMTGFGRTGRPFAFQHDEIVPDIVALGKAMGGGIPVSATVARSEIMDKWPKSEGEAIHTSTYNGHPLACRAAFETLGIHRDEALAERSAKSGAYVFERLRRWGPRGRGLMVGIELESGRRASEVSLRALRNGLIVGLDGPGGEVIAILPPLNTPRGILDEGIAILEGVLEQGQA